MQFNVIDSDVTPINNYHFNKLRTICIASIAIHIIEMMKETFY